MAPTRMEYVRLGDQGLKASKIILGCMSYGDPGWASWVLGEEEGVKHIKFAHDHGITTFDTSNVYSDGLSEIILGKAIKQLNVPREELAVMTKVNFPIAPDYGRNTVYLKPEELAGLRVGVINQKGLNRKHIFDSVKASLDRLQLDYVDVLKCHRFDYNTHIEETMLALHDVVKAGYTRNSGMSSCWTNIVHYAIQNKLTPFISIQNHVSLAYREEEGEMLPALQTFGVGSIPWSPLARGLLTRPYPVQSKTKRSTTNPTVERYKGEASVEIVKRVEILAKKGAMMAEVALARIMSKPGVSAPIVGTTSVSNLADLLGALDATLADEEQKYLEEPYKPVAIEGHFSACP